MSFLKSHKLLILTSALTTVAVAALTVTITWAGGITFEGGQPEPARGHSGDQEEDDASQLLREEPDWLLEQPADRGVLGLSFCVDTFGLDESDETAASLRGSAKSAVFSAIQVAKENPLWDQSNADARLPATFYEGCPQPPFPSVTGDDEWKDGEPLFIPLGRYFTEEKRTRPYQFFVFVMPIDQIDELLGGTSTRIALQDMRRDGHTFFPVSFGVYLTPEEVLGDSASVIETMEYALGFRY